MLDSGMSFSGIVCSIMIASCFSDDEDDSESGVIVLV